MIMSEKISVIVKQTLAVKPLIISDVSLQMFGIFESLSCFLTSLV